jgi:anaerobic magnesium-protoporphyrin IX monomethyl ester cyclase
LINPPLTHYEGSTEFDLHLPLGLMYVAAMIRDVCEVEIFDCLLSNHVVKKSNAYVYGATEEEIRNVIENNKPDVVGISVHSTTLSRNAELIAKIAKDVNPKIITVFGGPDPSVQFETFIENQYCDYCVVGDGEETFLEFVKAFASKTSVKDIAGLAFKSDGVTHFVPRVFSAELDFLPFPAFDLIDLKKYLKNKKYYKNRSDISKKSTSIITSRGCPNNCVFCSVRLHMGQKYRAHSPEYVIKLLRLCIEKYGLSNFHFEDDNLTSDQKRFESILDLIIKEKLQIKWDTPNGVRADKLNYNLLKKMKKAGCFQLTLAIESGNQRVLDKIIHKGLNLEYVHEVVKYCKKLKISTNAFYVIGFPGETSNEIRDTINFATQLFRQDDVYPTLMVATPLIGTELYDICVKDKLIEGKPTPEALCVAIQTNGEPMISTGDFSKEDIKHFIKEFRKKNQLTYIRYVLKYPRNLPRYIRSAIKFR